MEATQEWSWVIDGSHTRIKLEWWWKPHKNEVGVTDGSHTRIKLEW